jgi:hypothetical protein
MSAAEMEGLIKGSITFANPPSASTSHASSRGLSSTLSAKALATVLVATLAVVVAWLSAQPGGATANVPGAQALLALLPPGWPVHHFC